MADPKQADPPLALVGGSRVAAGGADQHHGPERALPRGHRRRQVCRLLAGDGNDIVVKALSSALRELVVHDPQAVRAFLDEHESVLAARVKREVRNKLVTGLKNPGRRAEGG